MSLYKKHENSCTIKACRERALFFYIINREYEDIYIARCANHSFHPESGEICITQNEYKAYRMIAKILDL